VTDPRVEIVARGYDRIAERFAVWQGEIEDDPRAAWADDLISRLPDDARVLELGCGSGSRETLELARRFWLTGVDASAEQIRRARDRVPGADFLHADFLELGLPEASFDAVCSFYVFNHVPREHLGPLLERIATWLRPGGFTLNAFGVSDLEGWTGDWLGAETYFSSFEPPENRRLVEAAGLTIVRDEVVELVEPEGPVRFQWILASR
jgi:SAM-dependent methyltransferase